MNSKKIREALSEIIDLIDQWRIDGVMEHWQYSQLFDIADEALSSPPRNCDVGTAKEQGERWRKSCKWLNAPPSQNRTCFGCPVHNEIWKAGKSSSCELVWAQMPYEKGGAE